MILADGRSFRYFLSRFYPRFLAVPADVSTIFLSRTGSDSNSGLTVLTPVKTFQRAFDILATYGPMLEGRWRLQATAGTYPEPVSVSGLSSRQPIGIFCPNVGVNNQPTVIVDGSGVASRYGWQFLNFMQLYMEHVEFKNWTYDTQSSGLYLEGWVRAYLKNTWFTDNHWGVEPKFHCHLNMNSGKMEGNEVGAYVFTMSSYDFGANATAVANGPIVLNNTEAGIRLQENCSGHVDYCTIDGNAIGVDIREGSRASFNSGGDVKNNTIAVRAFASAALFYDDTIDWNQGTVDANTRLYDFYSGSQDYPLWFNRQWRMLGFDPASHAKTGDTNINSPFSLTIPAQMVDVKGKGLRARVSGFFEGPGTKTVSVFLSTTILSFTSSADSTNNFVMDFEFYPTSAADGTDAQRVRGAFLEAGQLPQNGGSARAIDMSADQTLLVSQQLSDAAGTSTITTVMVEILG